MRAAVTGSAGPVGASFAVVSRGWRCESCRASNGPRSKVCSRCRSKRADSGDDGCVWDHGATSSASGQDHNWREAMDPASKQIYYYNKVTKETRWERPEEMGQAIRATGWFGRGKAGAKSDLDEKNAMYLKRPAPKQAESTEKKTAYVEGADTFNIWYGKYQGERWSQNRFEPAPARCKVELHAGYTKADKDSKNSARFCLYFAKGLCNKGKSCTYYHRIPTYADCGVLEKDMMHDVFGRERHAKQKDDMQGVGSFNSPSRSLYVGRLQRARYEGGYDELKVAIERHFEEWGEVESVDLIWPKAIAFVRYRFRSHAEFAKEAMANQALDHEEVLDVRWAFEDQNPIAREATERANADAMIAAMQAAGYSLENIASGKNSQHILKDNESGTEKQHNESGMEKQHNESEKSPPSKRQKQ